MIPTIQSEISNLTSLDDQILPCMQIILLKYDNILSSCNFYLNTQRYHSWKACVKQGLHGEYFAKCNEKEKNIGMLKVST